MWRDKDILKIFLLLLIVLGVASVSALLTEGENETWRIIRRCLASIMAGCIVILTYILLDYSVYLALVGCVVFSSSATTIWPLLQQKAADWWKGKKF